MKNKKAIAEHRLCMRNEEPVRNEEPNRFILFE